MFLEREEDGEMSLFGGLPRSATVRTETGAVLLGPARAKMPFYAGPHFRGSLLVVGQRPTSSA